MTTKPLILFIHIPKTGGSSIINAFAKVYGADRAIRISKHGNDGNYERVRDILVNEPFKYDAITSHVGHIDFHTLPLKRPVKYFTMMRHPVQREVSRYYYIRGFKNHALHETFKQYETLESALPLLYTNLQTRLLSGLLPHETPTRAHLEEAKHNLESLYLFVGVLERFDETLLLLNCMLEWSYLFMQPPHLNTAKRRNELTPAVIQKLEEGNALDMELYGFVNQLLDRRIREAGLAYQRDKFRLSVRRSVRQAKLFVRSKLKKDYSND